MQRMSSMRKASTKSARGHFKRIPHCALVLALLVIASSCAGSGRTWTPIAGDAVRAARLKTSAPFTPTGQWIGIFLNGMQVVRVDLKLRAEEGEGGVHLGEATFSELNLIGQPAKASSRAEVLFKHDELIGKFTLQVQRVVSADRGAPSPRFRDLRGVTDSVHHRFAGMQGAHLQSMNQLFRFTRPDEFDATLAMSRRFTGPGPRVRTTLPGQRRRTQLRDLFIRFDKPDPATAIAWATEIEDAYDEYDNPRPTLHITPIEAVLLFADDPFTRAFGAPFDALSDAALDGIFALFQQDLKNHPNRRVQGNSTLASMFMRSDWGTTNGLQTLHGVLALRTMRHWLAQRIDRVSKEPAGPEGYQLSIGMEELLESKLATVFWPDERFHALSVVDDARDVQAYLSFERSLDELERAPHTRETWDALREWRASEGGRYRITPEEREVLNTRRKTIMDNVLNHLLEPYRNSRPIQGDNISWIAKEVSWWARLKHDNIRMWHHDPVKHLRAKMTAERAEALASVLPELERTIATMPLAQLPEVDKVWFSLPGDKDTPVYAAVIRAIEQRQIAIDAAIVLAERRALALVRANPSRPLPFIDVRKYHAPGFLRFVYFGESDGIDGQRALDAWNAGDLKELTSELNLHNRFRAAFRLYHRFIYEQYGKTASQRAKWTRSRGEKWSGIQTVSVDQWGDPVDHSEGFTHTWVRTPYAQKYTDCEATEAELIGSLWLGLASANKSAKTGRHPFDPAGLPFKDPTKTDTSPLESTKATREEYEELFKRFVADFESTHPATVRHFERNLMALVSNGQLERITRLDVDGL